MRIPVTLFLIALLARVAAAVAFPDPAYPDSSYYVDVARQVAAGHGFNVDFVWIFPEVGGAIPASPVLPVPSNAHWMPLASIVQVPFIWLLGPTMLASLLPFLLIGSLAAPLAWAIARDARAPGYVAVGAGLLAAFPLLTLVFMAQPDNFALFEMVTAGSLFLASRGLRGSAWSFAVAGLLAGLATLSRSDGAILVAMLAAVFLWDRLRSRWPSGGSAARPARIPLKAAFGSLALFAAVMGPWLARQLAVFGAISPSSSTGKVMFIRDFGEWNSITTPATLDHLLGMGIGPLLLTRLEGFLTALLLFSVLACAILLVPPLLVGAWQRRHDEVFGPAFAYAFLFVAASSVLFAIHVPGGMFIHSAVGLLPHAYVLALVGLVAIVNRVATWRPRMDVARAARLVVGGAVVFGIVCSVAGVVGVRSGWEAKRERMQAVAAALTAAGVPMDDRLMSTDASGYRYWTGRPGVVLVNDPLETVEHVARAYDVRWLVLDLKDDVPASTQILVQGERPAWVGPPLLERADVAVYPVCLGDTDARCAGAARPGARS